VAPHDSGCGPGCGGDVRAPERVHVIFIALPRSGDARTPADDLASWESCTHG
jgi:hypothetical protein